MASFKGKPWALLAGVVAAACVLVGLALALSGTKTGTLVVTVAGPDNVKVEDLQILVNGERACTESPCRIPDLEGTVMVKVSAKGFQPMAEQAIAIKADGDTIHRAQFSENARIADTGLELPLLDKPLEVFINGKKRGNLPLRLTDLKPGPYIVKFVGDEGLSVEKEVTVEKNRMQLVEPPREDEQAGEEAVKTASRFRSRAAPAPAAKTATSTQKATNKSETGILNLNSIPASTIVLNGRPLGRTPRRGVKTHVGANTVVFIHPSKGRKVRRVTVGAGETKSIGVRF